jgi:hypothetical protein
MTYTSQTTQAWAAMADRWFVLTASARMTQPRVELRLREAATHDGRTLRMLTLIDEYTRGEPGDPGPFWDEVSQNIGI